MPDLQPLFRLCSWALFLLLGLQSSGCAHIAAQSTTGAAVSAGDLLSALSCTPFEWEGLDGLSEKAAIYVPVELDQESFRLQLDTGADVSILYGNLAEERGWKATRPETVEISSFRAGGQVFSDAEFRLRREMEIEGTSVGTLGLASLIGHLVVLDFPRQRFCLIPRAEAPGALLARTELVPAQLHDGKFFVDTRINGRKLEGVFYDSGSSAFPFWVDLDLWKELTGRSSEGEATHRIEVSSWGKMIPMFGAPATGALEIGAVKIEHPMVYYHGANTGFFAGAPFRTDGLFGNAAFLDQIVVLDLGDSPSFGLLR